MESVNSEILKAIPPLQHRKIMVHAVAPRPTYDNATSVSAGFADTSSNRRLGTLRQRDIARLILPIDKNDDALPSIHGLFTTTADAELKTCSLEYWLSIFGTTGGTVGHAGKFPVEIMNELFVGDDSSVRSLDVLQEDNVRILINTATSDVIPLQCADHDEAKQKLQAANITYMPLFGLEDSPASTILPYFAGVCDTITRARRNNQPVLVCSTKGANRSVCVVMAYLIQSEFAASIRQAASIIKEVHASARVSRRFVYDLDQFMSHLSGSAQEEEGFDEEVEIVQELIPLSV